MKVVSMIALFCLLLLSAGIFILSQSADEAIAAYVDVQSQPVGAAELALQSRQTPVIADQTRSFGGAGLLALALVAVGAMVFVMRGGTDLLKQWRLIRKRPSPPHHQPMPYLPTLPDYPTPPLDTLPRAQRPQELPQWTQSDQS